MFEYDESSPTSLIWTTGPRAGMVAGGLHQSTGRMRVKVAGKQLMISRVIWELFNGDIPEGMIIDHKDGNTLNNKPSNLRLATPSQNCFNRKKIEGKELPKGISYRPKEGCYRASIRTGMGKRLYRNSKDIDKLVDWLNDMRENYHKDFSNSGTHVTA